MKRSNWKVHTLVISPAARGTLMFLTGLGLTIREALMSGPDRPSLYILYAGMMGLPFVWNKTGSNGNGDGGKQ